MSKKGWLSMHTRNFGGHMTVRTSARPFSPQGNECLYGFLQPALKIDPHYYSQLTTVKKGYPLTLIR